MPTQNVIKLLYARRPMEAPAFELSDGAVLTTGEVLRRVAAVARSLIATGVSGGDRVSFRLEKSVDALILVQACLSIGAIIHPLNTSYTDDGLRYQLSDCRPRLLVCEPHEESRLEPLAKAVGARVIASNSELFERDEFSHAVDECPFAEIAADSVAAILYTSGTTGRPKGARITQSRTPILARR